MADAPQDILGQAATAEGNLANSIVAPLGINPSQRPPTPLELASSVVSGGKLPGASGLFKLPPLPKIPGITSVTPARVTNVGGQATEKVATTASYY